MNDRVDERERTAYAELSNEGSYHDFGLRLSALGHGRLS